MKKLRPDIYPIAIQKIINTGVLHHIVVGVRLQTKSKFEYLKLLLARKKVIGTIIILLCTTLVAYPEIIPWYTNHEMEWDITTGSILTYRITYTSSYSIHSSWTEYGVEVVFEIIFLPSIPRVVTTRNFQEEIIDSIKVECTYKNGSSLSSEYSSIMNTLISGSLLPVRGSSLLGQLFPDFQSYSGSLDFSRAAKLGTYYYLQQSPFNVSNLIVGYSSMRRNSLIGSSGHGTVGNSWFGSVSIQTGIPQNGTLRTFSPTSCGSSLTEEIFLELVDVYYASE